MRITPALALPLACAIAVIPAAITQDFVFGFGRAAAEEAPTEIIAAQIRTQGYTCNNPGSAEREQQQSGDAVWILKCENASFRVRLIPDMAADVERLD